MTDGRRRQLFYRKFGDQSLTQSKNLTHQEQWAICVLYSIGLSACQRPAVSVMPKFQKKLHANRVIILTCDQHKYTYLYSLKIVSVILIFYQCYGGKESRFL